MAQHILLASCVAFALGVGAVAWHARVTGSAPVQSSSGEMPDTGCSNPAPAMLAVDVRVNSGV